MDGIINNVKRITITDENKDVRILTIETTKGDYQIFCRRSSLVKKINVSRKRIGASNV